MNLKERYKAAKVKCEASRERMQRANEDNEVCEREYAGVDFEYSNAYEAYTKAVEIMGAQPDWMDERLGNYNSIELKYIVTILEWIEANE